MTLSLRYTRIVDESYFYCLDKLIAGVEALDSDEPLNVTEEEMQYELDLEAKEYAESCSPE